MSRDQAFGGLVTVDQYLQGYRFSIDALWLVAAARAFAKNRVVDLGAGCGIIGLSLAQVAGVSELVLVERQPRLAALAAHNIGLNQINIPVQTTEQDLRDLYLHDLPGPADLVVFNPPFFDPASSRPSLDPEQNAARRSLAGSVEDFIATAARILSAHGNCALVFPAQQAERVRRAFEQNKLTLHAQRYIYKNVKQDARLLVAIAGFDEGSPCATRPSWYEFDDRGEESEHARQLRERWPLIGTRLSA